MTKLSFKQQQKKTKHFFHPLRQNGLIWIYNVGHVKLVAFSSSFFNIKFFLLAFQQWFKIKKTIIIIFYHNNFFQKIASFFIIILFRFITDFTTPIAFVYELDEMMNFKLKNKKTKQEEIRIYASNKHFSFFFSFQSID